MGKATISHADRYYAGDIRNFWNTVDPEQGRGIPISLLAMEYFGTPGAAAAQSVVANVATPAAGDLTLTTTTGVVFDPAPRNITITSNNAGDTARTANIMGLDANGLPQAETITFNGAATVNGVKTFRKVLRVIISTTMLGTVSVGNGIIIGLRAKTRNLKAFKVSLEAGAIVAGAAFDPGNNTVQTATTVDQRAKYTPTTPASDIIVLYDPDLTKEGGGDKNFVDPTFQRQVDVQ